MELKVVCYCGQKYKFDVEPVDGRMPYTVNCPVCGADGTVLANQLISQQLAAGAPPIPTLAAHAPVMAAAVATAPPPVTGGLRINVGRPVATAVPPPLAPSAAPPPLASPRPMAPIRPLMNKPIDEQKEFSMGLGILGAFLGAAIGGALVYAFFLWAGFRFPFSGIGIGALTGYGARLLARGTDNTLGFIAGAFALISVLGAYYLIYGDFFIIGIISIIICVGFAYRIASG